MNSSWQMNRIGLVDFWYYDQEEFYFIDGRMLLRGSNGSGKSVTMQSFIPLLLDGNIRPERLDPFGSRARKMENYLLEENDPREERTGYLFMEFKRAEADAYLAIGMGMRARKNKKMDSWYFYIHNGRRINIDFPLYKEGKSKITLSKQELKNRIGEDGKVFDTQTEYMEMVNKQIFGFQTLEEYKEMIDLLIQLRTPKLSKDFKPSVLNEILGNSLASLSEDDLRPMSEAIENMDNLKTNLNTLKGCFQAAKKMEREYKKYNETILLEKAKQYVEKNKALLQLEKTIREMKGKLEEDQKGFQQANQTAEDLKMEESVLRKEQDSLNNSDAKRLVEQEQGLKQEILEKKKEYQKKEENHTAKRELLLELEDKRKQQKEKSEQLLEEIKECLEEMEEQVKDVTFDEHDFMAKDILEHPEQLYSYDLHREQLEKLQNGIEMALKKLQEEELERKLYDQVLQSLEDKKMQRSGAEIQWHQTEKQLYEIRNELTENIYRWRKECLELVLSDETMQKIAGLIQQYTMNTDYEDARSIVRREKLFREEEQKEKLFSVKEKLRMAEKNLEDITKNLEEWEQKAEPEPELSPERKENRKRLQEAGIPYYQFYKTIDFISDLPEKQADYLEEALLSMGVLDALIIPSQYRDRVLGMEPGTRDVYFFDDVEHVKNNIGTLLEVDNQENDILFYQQISSVLSSIGYEEPFHTVVKEDGSYQLGSLTGTITKEYKAKFIGVKARDAFRQKMIGEWKEKQKEAMEEKAGIQAEKEVMEARIQKLAEEQKDFPDDIDLRIAARDFEKADQELGKMQEEVKKLENQAGIEAKKLSEIRNEAQIIAGKVFLPARLEIFETARDDLRGYEKLLGNLQITHNNYLNGLANETSLLERLEKAEEDVDQVLYDITKLNIEIKKCQDSLISVQEQLKLTDYEQIKERLEFCVNRLYTIPEERESWIKKREQFIHGMEDIQNQLVENQNQEENLNKKVQWMESVFIQERKLGYVELPFPKEEKEIDQAKKVLQIFDESLLLRMEDFRDGFQRVYLENRGELAEYSLEMKTVLYEDEKFPGLEGKRLDLSGKYRGTMVSFFELVEKMDEAILEQEKLLSEHDRELFEDILANTISKKIRAKIYKSTDWVNKMNVLMGSMQTSSGLTLNLKWKAKRAEHENQMDTKELVELLKKDTEIMKEEEFQKLSEHFRSKIAEARKLSEQTEQLKSFHLIMKEVLDYRKWFEFQLECKKTGENKKELTDRVFFTFSGGEKAMSMYVPLFSAVAAKYEGANGDAPKLISLDEAFAGVDEMNIKDMFRLMVEFHFNFIINSQILYGDYETVPGIAIYQLLRPENAKFVTVLSYIWNGRKRILVQNAGEWMEEKHE